MFEISCLSYYFDAFSHWTQDTAGFRPQTNQKLDLIMYEGGSICNENPFITSSINALGFYAICQTKDQSVAVIMV